jgi:phage I-like protein
MIVTLKPLLNRGTDGTYKLPEDGYYQVVPYGEFPHKPTGLMQIVDNKAGAAILAAFEADKNTKAKTDDPGILLCDYDHFSGDAKLPSKASGWIEDLQNRTDGIYAKIRWTPEGEKAVTSGDYRYPSPSFKPDEIEWIDNKTIRPLRLDRVGITNDPNMKTIKPLSNRSETPAPVPQITQRAVTHGMIDHAGNSQGALKGWETRHRGLASVHAKLASDHLAAGRTAESATHQELAEKHLAKADDFARKSAASNAAGAPKRAATKADLAAAKAKVKGKTRDEHLADANEAHQRGLKHAKEYDDIRRKSPEDRAGLASASAKMKKADEDERASRAAASRAGSRDRGKEKAATKEDLKISIPHGASSGPIPYTRNEEAHAALQRFASQKLEPVAATKSDLEEEMPPSHHEDNDPVPHGSSGNYVVSKPPPLPPRAATKTDLAKTKAKGFFSSIIDAIARPHVHDGGYYQ